MSDARRDLLIIGSGPLALLLAGILAQEHGRSVALLAAPPSPLLPPMGFDASVLPATRPETWALLRRAGPETVRLLSRLGRRLAPPAGVEFRSNTATGGEALSHMRHLASGFGLAVERIANRHAAVYRFGDARIIDHALLQPAVAAWHQRLGVLRLDARTATVAFGREGATVTIADETIAAERVVLADDAAIVRHLDAARLPQVLEIGVGTAVLLDGAGPLETALEVHVDTGAILARVPAGIAAAAPGTIEEGRGLIAAALGTRTAWVGGALAFPSLTTRDGGPLIGEAQGALLLAGLGCAGAFLAPAIARFIAGVPAGDEAAWFAARQAGRDRGAVAEPRPARPQLLAS